MAEIEPGATAVMYRASAPVRTRSYTKAEREALLNLLQQRVNPDVFEGEDAPQPFFFSVEASNDRVDSYFTRMAKSSLKNYAADATDPGVQFQVSHNGAGTGGMFGGGSAGEVGFGRSLQGKFLSRSDNPSTVIDFYTIPGLVCGNMTSDQFITGARTGIYADVSIGFTPGAFICNICNGDMLKRYELDWDDPDRCMHYPGFTYDVEKGNKTVRIQCIADVEEGHLNEVSTVYDGATPGAGILAVDMGRMMAARGKLNPLDHQLLENVYRVRIDMPDHVYGGIDVSGRTGVVTRRQAEAAQPNVEENTAVVEPELDATAERVVADQATSENPSTEVDDDVAPALLLDVEEREVVTPVSPEEPMERLRQKYDGKLALNRDPYKNIEFLADTVIQLHGRIKGMERHAEDGKIYRESLLTELDTAVVRAFSGEGAEERKARYRRLAEREDVSGIRELITDLEAKAGERFQGGRLTKDVTEESDGEIAVTGEKPKARKPTPAHLV